MGDIRDPESAERLASEAPDEYLKRRDFLQRAAVTAGLAAGLGTVLDPNTIVAEAARHQRRRFLPAPRNLPVDAIVVLMMENRSFDHYLGWMPNADGRQAGLQYTDTDPDDRGVAVGPAQPRRAHALRIRVDPEVHLLPLRYRAAEHARRACEQHRALVRLAP